MPLANSVIMRLNEITTMVANKDRLDAKETELIKEIFGDVLKGGELYDVDEIESWFENEGSWKNRAVRARIQNLAHYVQSKHEQTARLRVVGYDQGSCSDEPCCDH